MARGGDETRACCIALARMTQKGRPSQMAERPVRVGAAMPHRFRAYQAAVLIFAAASAKRFEIGWKLSPASLTIASLFFDAWATSVSKLERT